MRLYGVVDSKGNQNLAIQSGVDYYLASPELIPGRLPEWIGRVDFGEFIHQALPITKQEFQKLSLIAPIRKVEKLICIGKNYAEHAREMGGDPPEKPVVFSKFNSAISNPNQDIALPSISQKVDYEAELVVVIGKAGRNISQDQALNHVFGYCCGNDISARDIQNVCSAVKCLIGKTIDSFAPIGPFILTADEVGDPGNLNIRLRLNGTVMQDSNTENLIFPIDFLIAHISKFVTLQPGDLLFTGTPPGVGAGRKPPVFLKPGDQVEVEIEKLGVLANRMVAPN
ncbi:MAG: fumarylacetoacetate hydrolase family protein [Planctomycetota bacterium]